MRKLATVLMAFAFLLSGRVAWAQATVSGTVFEQDGISPIAGAVVTFSGVTELSDTLFFQFVTDSLGCYNDSILAGSYRVWASAGGYETAYLSLEGKVAQDRKYKNYRDNDRNLYRSEGEMV
jgi:hypothetical protein